MSFFKLVCIGLLFLSFSQACFAYKGAVVVNLDYNTDLSYEDIRKLYLNKHVKQLSNVLMIKNDDELTYLFLSEFLQFSSNQFRAYWSKLVFTGKGRPPKKKSTQAIIKKVVDDVHTIGFIRADDADLEKVKIMFYF